MKLRQVITQTVHAPVRKTFKLIRKSLEKKIRGNKYQYLIPKSILTNQEALFALTVFIWRQLKFKQMTYVLI